MPTNLAPGSITVGSGVTVSSTVKKFNKTAIAFDGTANSHITVGTNITLTGAFTIEAFVYITDASRNNLLLTTAIGGYGSGYDGFGILSHNSFGLCYFTHRQGYSASAGGFYTGVYPSVNQWHHVAITRDATNTWRFFIDGVLTPHSSRSEWYATPSATVSIGLAGRRIGTCTSTGAGSVIGPAQTPMNGYLDEYRITEGVARYTSTFTVPAGPHPNR